MKLGDQVYWESQAAGITQRKEGKIVEIVPAGRLPETKRTNVGAPRDHESYVVRATKKSGKRVTSALYWPLVKYLRPTNQDQGETHGETEDQAGVGAIPRNHGSGYFTF